MSLYRAVSNPVPKTLLLAGVVSAAGLLVACGSEKKSAQAAVGAAAAAPAAPTKLSFDPCALATLDEVKAAVGWTPTSTKRYGGQDKYGSCDYAGRTDPMLLPPEKVEVGISTCVTNMPCYDPIPEFRTSREFVDYRIGRYKKDDSFNVYETMHPSIVPLDGFGVPAIEHELASNRSIEMYIGPKRVLYVTTWVAAGPTRELAKKVLARAR